MVNLLFLNWIPPDIVEYILLLNDSYWDFYTMKQVVIKLNDKTRLHRMLDTLLVEMTMTNEKASEVLAIHAHSDTYYPISTSIYTIIVMKICATPRKILVYEVEKSLSYISYGQVCKMVVDAMWEYNLFSLYDILTLKFAFSSVSNRFQSVIAYMAMCFLYNFFPYPMYLVEKYFDKTLPEINQNMTTDEIYEKAAKLVPDYKLKFDQ